MRKPQSDATRKFYVAVGKRIADARLRFPKTQEALASELELNRATVVNIERGRQQLLLHTIVRIARSLKVSPESLIPEFVVNDEIPIENFVKDAGGLAWIENSLRATNEEPNGRSKKASSRVSRKDSPGQQRHVKKDPS